VPDLDRLVDEVLLLADDGADGVLEDLPLRPPPDGFALITTGAVSSPRARPESGVLVVGNGEGWRQAMDIFTRALEEVGNDVALRARAEQGLGWGWLFRGDLEASERHARAALRLAEELRNPG
jgi:hypothetical protein